MADLTELAASLLDELPANKTLGLTVESARDGSGSVVLPVADHVVNVIGALHSSGLMAMVDAAALAAVISCAPDAATARRIQPLGTQADLTFERPVRGVARAECQLIDEAVLALTDLFVGRDNRVRLTTDVTVGSDEHPDAVRGTFTWTIRLAG